MSKPFSDPVKRLFAIFTATALLVLFDQWTKGLAVRHLKNGEPFILIGNILELVYVENTGAAFGILKGQQWFFYVTAIVVSLAAVYFMLRMPKNRRFLPLAGCLLFIIAGALGNLIDRFRHAYVVDFIYFKPIDFPVFNVADIYITCACALLIFLFLFYYKEDELKFL